MKYDGCARRELPFSWWLSYQNTAWLLIVRHRVRGYLLHRTREYRIRHLPKYL